MNPEAKVMLDDLKKQDAKWKQRFTDLDAKWDQKFFETSDVVQARVRALEKGASSSEAVEAHVVTPDFRRETRCISYVCHDLVPHI
jgi:hypothetical protein